MSLRLRLTLIYTGLVAAALILFSTLLYAVLGWSFTQSVDRTLTEVAGQVTDYFQTTRRLPFLNSLSDRSTFVLVRTRDQALERGGEFTGLFPLPPEAEQGTPVFTTATDARGEPYRLYTLPIALGDRQLIYVQVAHSLQVLQRTTAGLQLPLVLSTAVFLGLAALGAWLLAGRAIAPIRQVAQAAEAIGQSSDLSLRVPDHEAAGEVGTLVHTFNAMLDQLQGLYGRLATAIVAQQRFVADASHELRTPLTIIRGNVEYMQKAGVLDQEALADVASEAARMSQLVDELLTAARADAGQEPELKPVALGPLVREACRKAEALPHEAALRIDLPEALDRITLMGHAEWLRRAVLILIDNAFKYTPAGSVTVRAGRQGDGVVLQVADTGIGIPAEDLPHVFERFYRADRARTRGGTGLGLSIAQWVAGMHGGSLTVESAVGKGSTFSLWLPLDRAQRTGRDS